MKLLSNCSTCAHSTGIEGGINFYCKLWNCNFCNTRRCEYYHGINEPIPFLGQLSPSERELHLIHMRRYEVWDSLNETECQKVLEMQKYMSHELEHGNTETILKK